MQMLGIIGDVVPDCGITWDGAIARNGVGVILCAKGLNGDLM